MICRNLFFAGESDNHIVIALRADDTQEALGEVTAGEEGFEGFEDEVWKNRVILNKLWQLVRDDFPEELYFGDSSLVKSSHGGCLSHG